MNLTMPYIAWQNIPLFQKELLFWKLLLIVRLDHDIVLYILPVI